MIPLWLSLAGGMGAVTRFIVDGLIQTKIKNNQPWGTMLINASGSLLLGILTGTILNYHASDNIKLIIGTGFCGGYTTFSTASFETVRLLEKRQYVYALIQCFGNLYLCLGCAAIGIWLV